LETHNKQYTHKSIT